MELVSTNVNTLIYIESETEFNRAQMKGFWELLVSLVRGRRACLLSLGEVVKTIESEQSVDLGLRDVPVDSIRGSMNRAQDFTRHFRPCLSNKDGKERWRRIYTRVVTGAGFPPVEVY